MIRTVLDASAVASWLLESHFTSEAAKFWADAADLALSAPDILRLEIHSVLLKARRKGDYTPQQMEDALLALAAFDIEYSPCFSDVQLDHAGVLALEESLSIYDALYLQLALSRSAHLASRDKALLAAAERRGLATFNLLEGP